jgi:ferredoxin
MDCAAWRLTDAQLGEWVDTLLESGVDVVAPVEEDEVPLFRKITSAGEASLTPAGKTRWSPKEFLFPRSEALYGYRFDGVNVQIQDQPESDKRQVLIGVRCCDAAGLAHLDDVFLRGRTDSFYAGRRERTTVVTAACAAADPECFCTAVGGSPVGEAGSDLQLVPLADGWLVRVLSDKGRSVVDDAAEAWVEASAEGNDRVAELEREVAAQIGRSPVKKEWSGLLEAGFDHPVWDRLAQRCMGCSICAYVCPSCSCFDMIHEADTWRGHQCRSWDSCTFALFTRHASGHNPRSTPSERYRQRVLHKFSYADDDGSPFRCVGCGRCVALCPGGLDIVDVVATAVSAIEEEQHDAAG